MPGCGKQRGHFFPVPVEERPVWMLVNIDSTHHLRILYQSSTHGMPRKSVQVEASAAQAVKLRQHREAALQYFPQGHAKHIRGYPVEQVAIMQEEARPGPFAIFYREGA